MEFQTASSVEAVVYDMLLADFYRARNRVQINNLFNGFPPFSEEQVEQNQLDTNYNDLSATRIGQQARAQFGNALINPNPLVNVELDYGPVYRKREWGEIITSQLNKRIKNSNLFLEEEESTFAQTVLHGIAPAVWLDNERWVPDDKGVEDVLIPGGTYRSLKNLPFFAVYVQYSAPALYKCISGPNVDKGWNLELARGLIKWCYKESQRLTATWWPDPWKPEKWEEMIKENAGIFAGDRVPTIDTYHFYYYSDDEKNGGWRKKVILDSWGQPGTGAQGFSESVKNKYESVKGSGSSKKSKGEFLFDGGNRVYASDINQLAHWQFGDASAVAPFMYHSVRSLGFLLYAVCQLQNRMKCRFMDATFEAYMQYFRVGNPQDMERALKINLINRGVIPEGVTMLKQDERWQYQTPLYDMAMKMTGQTMADNSSSFTQDFDFNKENAEETATRTMAKVSSTSAMVGSMLNRAYNYQKTKQREIGRRFCIENSRDLDVRQFRLDCLKAGVPKEALNVERWNMEPVRVIGNGNKTLQVAMADKLMASVYDKLDGDGQHDLVRMYIAVNSDDYDLARRLMPDQKPVSPAVNQAQQDAGAVMQGIPVTPVPGTNEVDYIETQLHAMATIIASTQQTGGKPTKQQVAGLAALGQNVAAHIKALAKDRTQKQRVKVYSDDLGKLMNQVKAYGQQLAQAEQANSNGVDPETKGKIQAMTITAQAKAKLAADSHAQRTAQKQIQFEQTLKQKQRQHAADLAKTDLEAAANIKRGGMKAFKE